MRIVDHELVCDAKKFSKAEAEREFKKTYGNKYKGIKKRKDPDGTFWEEIFSGELLEAK